jgi:hypothetical protein
MDKREKHFEVWRLMDGSGKWEVVELPAGNTYMISTMRACKAYAAELNQEEHNG